MDERRPSTSNQEDVELDNEFMARVNQLPIEELQLELEMLENDTHPLLATVRRQRDRDRAMQADRIRCHRERAEAKVREDFVAKEREIEQEFDSRLAELQDEARKRGEELDRTTVHDYGVIDINKPVAIPLVFESNKKTLRGRGGGQLIEPATYFNANQGNKGIPEFNLRLAFDDKRIRRDLNHVSNRSDARRSTLSNVSIQKPKLIIDSKAFKHGEDVVASNSTYGEFLAKIDIVDDTLVNLKGVPTWDTRHISATLEDLEDGRVKIAKRGKERERHPMYGYTFNF